MVSSTRGTFHSTKNSALKFPKLHVPNGMVHSGYTNLTQGTARLVIVLVSRLQKSGTGNNNFVKEAFQSDWLKWSDWSRWSKIFRLGWAEMVPFHLISNRNVRNFGLSGKRPGFSVAFVSTRCRGSDGRLAPLVLQAKMLSVRGTKF